MKQAPKTNKTMGKATNVASDLDWENFSIFLKSKGLSSQDYKQGSNAGKMRIIRQFHQAKRESDLPF
ncbi:hypothetical protein N9243_00575 [bacterium]|nr:hypothetical protein [bacterium]